MTYSAGERVEYIAAPVFDLIIEPGDVGIVTRESDGWVFAEWPRSGEHSVPIAHVRPAHNQQSLDRARLVELLDADNVDPDSYNLCGERADEALILAESFGAWIVYYSERGLRSAERTFTIDAEACECMLDLLLRDPSTRRR